MARNAVRVLVVLATSLLGPGCDKLFSLSSVAVLDGEVTADDASAARPNVAFVSSTTVTPATLGVAGADAKCQELAVVAGLEGTYVAWVSTLNDSARGRLERMSPRGWVRRDGKPFADTVDDIAHGRIRYPLRITELGDDLGLSANDADLLVATATKPDGTLVTGSNCADFTTSTGSVTAGYADAGGLRWTAAIQASCSTKMHLYCFGTDRVTPTTVVPDSMRRAFVTTADIAAYGGPAGQDVECANEASAAGLTGTFLAAVGRPGSSIASRFASGAPWVRVDGVTVLTGDFSATPAPLLLDAEGTPQDDGYAMVGAASWAATTTTAETCVGWTATSGTTRVGAAERSNPSLFDASLQTCAFGYRVYCLQQ